MHLAVYLWTRGRRFLDKTPENCLRIRYLDELFPDATYVFLHRRAAENVNSLIQGWRARPRFVAHVLPELLEGIAPLDGKRWSFALIPGWRDLGRAPLEVICARQYAAGNEAVLAARRGMESARWVDVAYDELVARPAEQLRRLFTALGLAVTPAVEAAAVRLAAIPAATSLTPPRRDKWRYENLRRSSGSCPSWPRPSDASAMSRRRRRGLGVSPEVATAPDGSVHDVHRVLTTRFHDAALAHNSSN